MLLVTKVQNKYKLIGPQRNDDTCIYLYIYMTLMNFD